MSYVCARVCVPRSLHVHSIDDYYSSIARIGEAVRRIVIHTAVLSSLAPLHSMMQKRNSQRTYEYRILHKQTYTSIRAYVHTCVRACMHTCIHAYMHTFMRTFRTSLKHIHRSVNATIHSSIYAYVVYINMHAWKHKCTHFYIHTIKQAFTHIHTHSIKQASLWSIC